MKNYTNSDNYKYYKITDKSGCISINYNFKDAKDEQLIILNNINESSGIHNNQKLK